MLKIIHAASKTTMLQLLLCYSWGVYGQLGHGNTENVAEPKVLSFLKYKVRNIYIIK